MTTISYLDSQIPLRTDLLIEKRVRDLIGNAQAHQLWLMFLDKNEVQLPLLIPIADLPRRPDENATACVVGNIAEVMAEIGAVSLMVVWERCGPAHLGDDDSYWIRSFAKACGAARLPLRAVLMSHRKGVRWIGADDYLV
jgi:hypothetical protein